MPWWNGPGQPATATGTTVSWPEPFETDDSEEVAFYLVEVAGSLSAVTTTTCDIVGLASAATYPVRITAVDTNGEYSGDINPDYAELGERLVDVTTPAGSAVESNPGCAANTDIDGDGLPDLVETSSFAFAGIHDTGTSSTDADTDGDGISDGDEVLGTAGGLDLPAMGANPLRADLLVEFDWFDDDQSQMVNEPWYDGAPGGPDGCGQHSHQPTPASIAMVTSAFAAGAFVNIDGSTGVNMIADYGQGGVFTGGNMVPDADGVLEGDVSDPDFAAKKAANFATERNGYFHYVLLPHQYNDSSSSGQAEVGGDDSIVSLYCYNSDSNVSSTVMHELGHNLGLRHGGDSSVNYKPNYNSIMNYRYQFAGVEADCDGGPVGGFSFGDGVLDFSAGDLVALDELALVEAAGLCDDVPVDWNSSGSFDGPTPVSADVNFGGGLTVLTDHDDWGSLEFQGVNDNDGRSLLPTQLVTEQPVPPPTQN